MKKIAMLILCGLLAVGARADVLSAGNVQFSSAITIAGGTGNELVLYNDGRVRWRGHWVNNDDEFRRAVLALRRTILGECQPFSPQNCFDCSGGECFITRCASPTGLDSGTP